jgi:hypothetical protein
MQIQSLKNYITLITCVLYAKNLIHFMYKGRKDGVGCGRGGKQLVTNSTARGASQGSMARGLRSLSLHGIRSMIHEKLGQFNAIRLE